MERVRALFAAEGAAAFPLAAWGALHDGTHCMGTWAAEGPSDWLYDQLFDLASLTKVILTTTWAMRLWERGILDLDRDLGRGFSPRHLLLHNSGLPAHKEYWVTASDPEEAWQQILSEPLEAAPGERTEYSCVGFMTLYHHLGELVGGGVDQDAEFAGLLRGWGFRWGSEVPADTIPTEGGLQGQTHDENSRFLGGMAGNAGLFGSITAVLRFLEAQTSGQLAKLETVAEWTRRQTPDSTRALGWDTKSLEGYTSAGQRFGPKSYGHTGFTGTCIWVDPDAGIAGVLLTNRVVYGRQNERIKEFRPKFFDALYEDLLAE